MFHDRGKGPGIQQRSSDTNLDCAFVENALLFVVSQPGGPWPFWPPSTTPLTSMLYSTCTRVTQAQKYYKEYDCASLYGWGRKDSGSICVISLLHIFY